VAKLPYVGVVTTLRDDGSPHSTIVWVDVDDGKPSFNTATGRAKPKHLEHNPHASLLVVDPNDSYKWVAVSGHARMTEDGAADRQAREEVRRQGRVPVAQADRTARQGAD